MERENLKYWLAINTIPNLGPVTIKKLWDHFGSIEAVWRAEESKIWQIEGLSKTAVKAFLENRNDIDLDVVLQELHNSNSNVLTIEEDDYPVGLKNIYDPPPVLYFKGNILPADAKAVAIVGTRKASRSGLEFTRKTASELASLGITIVSGLASGIDTAAHQGALEAGGRTLAVFGCGVDYIFPAENRGLAKMIEKSGALISEFPIGTRTEKGNFPRRNRVISGLSLGVIVVEGHYDSGAMITAKQALDQGREVFAVPGQVGLEQSKGPHWLIKQGAKLVEGVEDVLEELNLNSLISEPKNNINRNRDFQSQVPLNEDESKIILVLSQEPKHLDNISLESGLPIPQVSSLLMMLEIKKAVRQLPGKNFVLSGR